MNEDLISRAALLKEVAALKSVVDKAESEETRLLLRYLGLGLEGWIKAAPAVDAVEVVRCKDCKYRGDAYECPKRFAHYHGEDSDFTVDDGYCELGEKLKLEDDDGETD